MKLGEICEYRNEKVNIKDVDSNDYISTDNMLPNFAGIDVIKSFPKVDKLCKYCIDDILISNIRPYFKKMIIADRESGCSSDVLVVKIKNKSVIPLFLFYKLRSNDFFDYVMSTSKGTKMPRGDKNAIMNYDVDIPSINDQYKIIAILKGIDDIISINNQINDNLLVA